MRRFTAMILMMMAISLSACGQNGHSEEMGDNVMSTIGTEDSTANPSSSADDHAVDIVAPEHFVLIEGGLFKWAAQKMRHGGVRMKYSTLLQSAIFI